METEERGHLSYLVVVIVCSSLPGPFLRAVSIGVPQPLLGTEESLTGPGKYIHVSTVLFWKQETLDSRWSAETKSLKDSVFASSLEKKHRGKGLFIKISELRTDGGELFSFEVARYRDMSTGLLGMVSYTEGFYGVLVTVNIILAVGGIWS